MFFRRNHLHGESIKSPELDSFAVLLKGSSLEKLKNYHSEFQSCFIVSDYNDELEAIGCYLRDKEITHFTNRSKQSSLSKKNYVKYGIREIQTGQVFRWNHFRLIETFFHYKMMRIGLNVTPLPEKLLRFHKALPNEYQLKFPNTGILSIIYALEIIRPKKLWVFGLDFYSKPYMVAQTQAPTLSLNKQTDKLERLSLPQFITGIVSQYPQTTVMMASYYPDWTAPMNMKIL